MRDAPRPGLRRRQLPLFTKAVGLAMSAGLLATSCAASDDSGSSSETSTLAIEQILTGEFETIGGPLLDLETIQNKDVVFWFWAPW